MSIWSSNELVTSAKLNKYSGMGLIWDSVDAGVSLPASTITTPTLDTSYAHLLVVYGGVSRAAASNGFLGMRINGDSSSHYYGERADANNAAWSLATDAASATSAKVGLVSGNDNPAYKGSGIVWIPYYQASAQCVNFIGLGGAFYGTGATNVDLGLFIAGKLNSAGTVSTITFLETGGNNIAAGSRFSVYGVYA